MAKPIPPDTLEVRHEFLRTVIRNETASHGAPCGCILCEALIFDSLSREGKYSLTRNKHILPS